MLGAAAGGIMGSLGRLFEPLDAPRQALWNLPGALGRGDFTAALPGIATAGGALLGALGMPLGLAGLALGGASQYMGSHSGDEESQQRFEAPTPSALLSALGGDPDTFAGQLASFGLGMAGDPLMWAGTGLGNRLLRTKNMRRNPASLTGGTQHTPFADVFSDPSLAADVDRAFGTPIDAIRNASLNEALARDVAGSFGDKLTKLRLPKQRLPEASMRWLGKEERPLDFMDKLFENMNELGSPMVRSSSLIDPSELNWLLGKGIEPRSVWSSLSKYGNV